MSSWWWFWWVCWWNSNDVIVILEVIEMLLISMLLNNCIAKWMNMNVWIFYYRVIMGHCKTGILPKCLPIENKVSINQSINLLFSLSLLLSNFALSRCTHPHILSWLRLVYMFDEIHHCYVAIWQIPWKWPLNNLF